MTFRSQIDDIGHGGCTVEVQSSLQEPLLAKKLLANALCDTFPETPVYLNDHLTPTKKHLMGLARQKKNEGHFKYLWSKAGTVYVKRTDTSTPIKLTNERDLDKLTQ